MKVDYSLLATVASLIGGFGISAFLFRINRELEVKDKDPSKPSWITLADLLILTATIGSFGFVVIPCILATTSWVNLPDLIKFKLPVATCVSASILTMAYLPAVIGHYWRSHFSKYANNGLTEVTHLSKSESLKDIGASSNGEPSEILIAGLGGIVALIFFVLIIK